MVGWVSAQVYTFPDGRVRITPFLCIVNSDRGILSESRRILAELATGRAKPRTCGHSGANLKCETIRLDGIGIKPVLVALLPYFRSDQKRRNAEIILRYLESRDARLLIRDERGRIRCASYSKAEVELIAGARSHKRAKSSEAICLAPNVVG